MKIEFKEQPEGGCRKWDCVSCGRHLKHDTTTPVAEITGGGMNSSPSARDLKFVLQHCDRFPVGTKLYANTQTAERAPLSDAQLLTILTSIDSSTKRLPPGFKQFARKIEKAHGIKGLK